MFRGLDDIRTYSVAGFRTEIMQKTRQKRQATLTAASFGMTDAKLDVANAGDNFLEAILEGETDWFKTMFFKTICPETAYRPFAVLSRVRHVYTDDNGNEARLNIHVYFMNLLIAVGCMGKEEFEIDVVRHAVDYVDPDIKSHLEANYDGHFDARKRDPLTQTKALQVLLIKATKAEKAVMATRAIAASNTTQIL